MRHQTLGLLRCPVTSHKFQVFQTWSRKRFSRSLIPKNWRWILFSPLLAFRAPLWVSWRGSFCHTIHDAMLLGIIWEVLFQHAILSIMFYRDAEQSLALIKSYYGNVRHKFTCYPFELYSLWRQSIIYTRCSCWCPGSPYKLWIIECATWHIVFWRLSKYIIVIFHALECGYYRRMLADKLFHVAGIHTSTLTEHSEGKVTLSIVSWHAWTRCSHVSVLESCTCTHAVRQSLWVTSRTLNAASFNWASVQM